MNVKENLVYANVERDNWDAFEPVRRRRSSKLWSRSNDAMATYLRCTGASAILLEELAW